MVWAGEVVGVQLFADGGGQFSADYNIKGIPRFILFGCDGNVIETNAPRPSGSELEGMLRALLTE